MIFRFSGDTPHPNGRPQGKRVLVIGESSHLNTGYAVMTRHLLSGLARTGKYELAELAVYGTHQGYVPQGWAYYPVPPHPDAPEEAKREYNSHPHHVFGVGAFERVCLEFAPDVVCLYSDTWMCSFAAESPYRPFYRFIYEPTVDGEPQCPEWLELYRDADALLSYTQYGKRVVQRESAGRVKVCEVAPPGVEIDVFTPPPLGRAEHREMLGIEKDVLIIGMLARNQVRKLFPDLFAAFAKFLQRAPKEIAERTYLYIHTCWPDLGWDLPMLMEESGVGSRVLTTYLCKNCGLVFPSFWADALTVCKRCKAPTAAPPNNQDRAIPPVRLADVYRLFDCYTQLSVCEGIGIPQMEAAACSVPVFAVDYSGMESVLDDLYPDREEREGFAIPVQRFYRDVHASHRKFALPDLDTLVEKWIDFLRLPPPARQGIGLRLRTQAETHYSWEGFVAKWEKIIDGVAPPKLCWDSPRRELPGGQSQPGPNCTNEEFVRWGLGSVAGRPDLIDSFYSTRLLHDLNWGSSLSGGEPRFNDMSAAGAHTGYSPYGREQAFEVFKRMRAKAEFFENARLARFEAKS